MTPEYLEYLVSLISEQIVETMFLRMDAVDHNKRVVELLLQVSKALQMTAEESVRVNMRLAILEAMVFEKDK